MANKNQLILFSDSAGKALVDVPSLGSDQHYVLPAAGGTLGGDILSARLNAEVAVSAGGTTCVADTWYKCTATSANYAITLPAVASSNGVFIGIRIDPSSTFVVTVTGNAAELIDGQNTRIMWSKESCVLYCDGATWTKVAGKTIPMSASLGVTANQTFANSGWTALNFTTALALNAPAAFQVAASSKLVALRPGLYNIKFALSCNSTNSTANNSYAGIYKNAGFLYQSAMYCPASAPPPFLSTFDFVLAANDYVQPYGYYSAGSYTTSFYSLDTSVHQNNIFMMTEIPTW